jgi:hypothetical protein
MDRILRKKNIDAQDIQDRIGGGRRQVLRFLPILPILSIDVNSRV